MAAVMAKHKKKDDETSITAVYIKYNLPQPEENKAASLAQKVFDLKLELETANA